MALLAAYGWDASNGHDDSGSGRDAVPSGPQFIVGRTGSGKALSASGDSNVNVATIAGIGPTTAITVSGWFRRISGNYHHVLTARVDSSGTDLSVALWGGDTDDLKPSFSIGTASAKAATPMDTGWHYIAGVYDSAGGGMKLYIDDTTTPAATAARTGAIPAYGSGAWCLFNSTSGDALWSNTDCDDLRFYDTALSSAALAADKAASVGSTAGSPLAATIAVTPTSIATGSTATMTATPTGGAGGTPTFSWEPLAGTPTATLSGQATATLSITATTAGNHGYRCTIARGSEVITRDATLAVTAPGSTTGVVSVTPGTWTKLGAGTDVAVVSDTDPATGHRSPDNPVAAAYDFALGAMSAPGSGVPHTEWLTMARQESTSGTLTAKLYEGSTLRSTVTVNYPAGTTAGQASTRVAVTFPAADLVAIAHDAWTTAGVMNVKTTTTVS